jgi:hypothetical protein
LFALLSIFLSGAVFAGDGGSIAGLVADASSARIPMVKVQLTNQATGVALRCTSNAEGYYSFPVVPIGSYELRATHEGFASERRDGVEVNSGAALRVDIVLQVESHSDTLVIAESSASIEPASTQLGEGLSASKMAAVPVNGRGFTDLLALQPGVIPTSSQQPNAVVMSGCTSAPPSGDLNPGNLSVRGQRETANGFTLNGASAQEDFNMGAAIVPNLDSIQEVRLLTGSFDAEYGNYGGAQVIVTSKSGGNQFHGSIFEYRRDTALDARNFFASERAAYDRDQYGATLGGPVRRARIFFFADFQGTRMRQGIETGRISVPSLADRTGDLSDLASSLTGTVNGQYWATLLTQRLGYAVAPGEPYYRSGCTTAEQCVLPGARIPQRAWSRPAQALLPYIPKPNQGANIFSTSSGTETLSDDKGAIRTDATTRYGSLSAYYHTDSYGLDNPYPTAQGGANVPGFNATSNGRAQLATLGLTTVLSATSVNELHMGYTRSANQIGQPAGGVGPTLASQGFTSANGAPGIVALAPSIEGIENVSFNDFTLGVDTTGVNQVNNTYQVSDSFALIRGTHSLKAGASMHVDQVNVNPDATFNGSFLFQGTETGSDFADFLLGIASSYAQGDSRPFYLRDHYLGLYAQDSWQLRPNLTLNYGARWDVLPPWHEKFNQLQTLVAGQQSVVYPGAPTGLVFPGDPGIPSTLAPTRYNDIAPRIGLAWSPRSSDAGWLHELTGGAGRTSVRAGYGLFYTAIEGLSAGIMSANPPYGYDYDSFAPPLFETPFVTAATGQSIGQRFPSPIQASGASAQQPDTSVDWSSYLPITGVPSFYARNVTPYSESYTLSLQREFGTGTVVSANYVGSEAHHLLVLLSANPGNPALCLSLSQPDEVAPGTATCGPFGESGIYQTTAGHQINGTRGPFSSQFAAVTLQKTIGNSDYNAFELSLRHSGRAAELQIAYTHGKSIDQSSSLSEAVNPLNPSLSRALSAFDMRHNFVASYDWKLPLEHRLGRSRWIVGWSLSGITRFSTGLPVTLYNNNDTSLLGTIPNGINNDGVDTPSSTGAALRLNTDPRNGAPAFNPEAFALPPMGQLGTAARRFFSGPGIVNFDLALHKRLALGETRALELRLEAFNAFNHAQFYGAAAVNGNVTSPSFGQIVSAAAPRQMQAAVRYTF